MALGARSREVRASGRRAWDEVEYCVDKDKIGCPYTLPPSGDFCPWGRGRGGYSLIYELTCSHIIICGIFFDLFSLNKEYGNSKSWFFFCEDDTILDLNGILMILNTYDSTKVVLNHLESILFIVTENFETEHF